jgi:hypothetical protein
MLVNEAHATPAGPAPWHLSFVGLLVLFHGRA